MSDKRKKRNKIKKILGILLISIPIDLELVAVAIKYGLVVVLIVVGIIAFLLLCIFLGVKLFIDEIVDDEQEG